MTSECLLCCGRSHKSFTISNVIKVLQSVISALETRSNEENAYKAQADTLHHKVEELSAGSEMLKEEKIKAEKRSDLYKQRFLDAQNTIRMLHEKNVQLSGSQKKVSVKPPSHFLFESALASKVKTENKHILVPDTCGFDLVRGSPLDYSVSSDEDDFQEPQFRKSPKVSKIVQKPKMNTIESYFVVPKSHAVRLKADTTIDFDETRLDVHDTMDISASLTDSELEIVNEEMDSIPPSPVLTGQRQRLSLRKCSKWEKRESSVLGLEDQTKINDPEETFIDEKVEADHKGDLSFLTQKGPKSNMSINSAPVVNTSLDEIFDKTCGNLETTSMLLADTCSDTEADEYDQEMEKLLFDAAENKTDGMVVVPPPSHLDDSFDLPPRREIVYKPNEVVRKKDERKKLEGRSCPQCEAYYSDLPASQRKTALKKVCRHKQVRSPPSTPDHFWEVDIPNTAECKRRGYITDETSKSDIDKQGVSTFRRKRPLQPFRGNKELSS